MDLKEIMVERYRQVKEQGWDKHSFAEECAIIHSEVSELFDECLHHIKPIYNPQNYIEIVNGQDKLKGIPSELADIIIKTCGYAEHIGVDLNAAVKEKLQHNANRKYTTYWI